MSIRDIHDYCVEQESLSQTEGRAEEFRHLHESLWEYSYGVMSKWFVGENNLDLDNDFVVLELDGLSNNQTFKALVLYMLMQNLKDQIYVQHKSAQQSGEHFERLVILDEAWDLLDKPFCASFIEKAYRQFRKFGASIGLIAQGFNDANRAKGGKGECILENCNWIFALKQKDSAVERAAKSGIIDIDDRQKYLIRSIQKNSDYSEFLVINTSNQADALCRFVTDKFTYAMYSSTAQQRAQIEKDVSKGMSRIEAVERLAAQLEESQMFKGDEKKASEESAA